MKLNQRKITKFVVYWFKNIENKQMHRFIKFDVKNFYPSISINTLQEELALAKNYCAISMDEIDSASLDVLTNQSWSMMDIGDGFYIPQGIFHGT